MAALPPGALIVALPNPLLDRGVGTGHLVGQRLAMQLFGVQGLCATISGGGSGREGWHALSESRVGYPFWVSSLEAV